MQRLRAHNISLKVSRLIIEKSSAYICNLIFYKVASLLDFCFVPRSFEDYAKWTVYKMFRVQSGSEHVLWGPI